MKKNVTIYLICFFIIFLTFNKEQLIVNSVVNSSLLFIFKVLPFFLPIYIISKVLINYNFAYYISKIFKSNIYVYILLTSFISGSPNNVILIKDLLDKKIINIDQANKFIKCSFFLNPLFIFGMIGRLFNKKIAILFIIIQILSNIIIYLVKPISNYKINKTNSLNLSDLLVKTINDSINILLYIYVSIITFNIIIVLLPSYLSNFSGLFEITSGLNYLISSRLNNISKILLATIYISFGGLAIHMQIKSVIKDTNILYSNFLLSRFYQLFIQVILAILYFSLF